MRSNGNRRAIIVGIFIFLGLAIFIWTVLTLGSQKNTFEKSIKVKAFFQNVNGLQKGNNIWFSGVKVGTIENVTLIGNNKVEVDMNIDEKSVPYIHKNAKAKLSSDGLIGNKIIEIYGGSSQASVISNGDVLNNEELLSTDAMMATLSKNNDNLLAITDNFKVISNKMANGQGSIGKLLTDETFADELNKTVITLKMASSNLQKLTANVSNYTSRLNDSGTLANDLVSDTLIFSKLRSTISQLQEVAAKSTEIMSSLQGAAHTVNEGLKNPNTPAGMLLGDEKTAAGLKTTMQNLQSASVKLNDDLEAVQHNFLLRGFFRKKAKAEKTNSASPAK
ncbi:MAG: MCE family protein [Bacteroidota bacterium]|nr:MCE family protein [Bacteroidota bacterium]